MPTTVYEQLFAVFALGAMGCVYAYAIGAICGIISTMDPAGKEYQSTRDLVKTWGHDVNMPPELSASLLEYHQECRSMLRQRYYDTLLEMLSPTLRGQVVSHTHGSRLQLIPFFQCPDPKESKKFLMEIAGHMKVAVYGKAEFIANAGDAATCMFIIAKVCPHADPRLLHMA